MFISEIKIENFRAFGSGEKSFTLALKPGLTAMVGENDVGKTAVIDALRLVLGTRDQEVLRLEVTDFHLANGADDRAEEITIRLTFKGLTALNQSAFAEYLTYVPGATVETALIVTWVAKRSSREASARRYMPTEWRTGLDGDGPLLDPAARSLLTATYLRPLRDAERAMGAGRGSRLSQILQHTKEIKESGNEFDKNASPPQNPSTLSVLGLGDLANHLFAQNKGVSGTRTKLNTDYLKPLSFAHDPLTARISVSGSKDDSARLRQLLEKLEVALAESEDTAAHTRGLGSNNLLFMACELLLLSTEDEGFPLLLIEEPEAHLHPQRQLRLMSFLQAQAARERADGQQIQILVTTHSPNLASDIKLDHLVLLQGRKAFPLSSGNTGLNPADYRFLERFLDVTKANLFFARAVMIVEGDAENILLPTLAKLMDRDFHEHGVSIVNVGGVGLGRYSRIFMRANETKDGVIDVPVACITDMDVMPDCAPWIVGKLKQGESVPVLGSGTKRQWRIKSDFQDGGLAARRAAKKAKASGQRVDTFVADEWTLEYDLARFGLADEVWLAAELALVDDKLTDGSVTANVVEAAAALTLKALRGRNLPDTAFASHIYARFEVDGTSKAIAAQYLSDILEQRVRDTLLTGEALRKRLPAYLVAAIDHVTVPRPAADGGKVDQPSRGTGA
jgi:putative ATP-dependent endonuclease of OLD family